MGDINIQYKHLTKTEAIQEYILSKFTKLEKFLHDNYRATINIIDNTPKKNDKNIEYQISIDLNNIEKRKNIKYNIKHKCKDLYAGIDEIISTIAEKLRRSHTRNVKRVKNIKDKILQNYLNLYKEIAY